MKKISELKRLKLTKEDLELAEQNLNEWAKSKFNEEEAQCGVCTYLAISPVGEEALFFVTHNNSAIMINAEASGIVEIGDFHNGYCEFCYDNGEKSIFAGTLAMVPFEVKSYLDEVYADPCSIADIPEEILKDYCQELCCVGSNSLGERFIKLKKESKDDSLVGLMHLLTLIQENDKYVRIVNTLNERYIKDESSKEQ